jgi:hypothetical protein
VSNLRSDSRDLVESLPAGDVYRSHIERLCHQIDDIESQWHDAERRLKAAREHLETAVCTEGIDKGVVMLSNHGPTHTETRDGRQVQVYDHDYFSPLGDALIAAWEATKATS